MTPQSDLETEVSDDSIMAFLDGELDLTRRQIFEAALQSDPLLYKKVEQFRQNDEMLRGSLNTALNTPLPTIVKPDNESENSSTSLISKLTDVSIWPIFRIFTHAPATIQFSAVLGLGIGIGNIFPVDDRSHNFSEDSYKQIQIISAAINTALENTASGTQYEWSNPYIKSKGGVTPLKTWKKQNNQYCREFEIDWVEGQESHSHKSIACRQFAGYWQSDLAL